MRVLFLWAKINHHAHVRYSLIFWDIPNFGVRHDEDGVCALLTRFHVALRHAPEILAEGSLPNLACGGVMHEFL
jgi:hypothetical protein